jgi:hypothetical protein
MVNKTLLPPGGDPIKPPSHSNISVFQLGTAFAL